MDKLCLRISGEETGQECGDILYCQDTKASGEIDFYSIIVRGVLFNSIRTWSFGILEIEAN